jgi:cyclopropane fatty-acyl-phospholipid synthase-like methyltransferase
VDPIDLPYSEAADRNKAPILAVLTTYFAGGRNVLEIGSGTGQHAVYFAKHLHHLKWHASDRLDNLETIGRRIQDAGVQNAIAPIEFDVDRSWPQRRFDGVFTANTLHIMPWDSVVRLFAGLPDLLEKDATIIAYGPFNYRGTYTSPSNARFDASLKANAAHQGIRDIEAVEKLAENAALMLVEDREMPANNRCLIFRRRETIQATTICT